jgi:hypothetical protein
LGGSYFSGGVAPPPHFLKQLYVTELQPSLLSHVPRKFLATLNDGILHVHVSHQCSRDRQGQEHGDQSTHADLLQIEFRLKWTRNLHHATCGAAVIVLRIDLLLRAPFFLY